MLFRMTTHNLSDAVPLSFIGLVNGCVDTCGLKEILGHQKMIKDRIRDIMITLKNFLEQSYRIRLTAKTSGYSGVETGRKSRSR